MTKRERLTKRNAAVRKSFDQLTNKHPEWRIGAIIEKIEEKHFLSPRTIEAIVKKEPNYNY